MTIVFGTYSFPIKKYKPSDLDLPEPEGEEVIIEVRLRVAHLFFIPLIPLERTRNLKIGTKKYELPWDYEKAFYRKKPGINPLTWLLGFILPIIAISYFAYTKIDSELQSRRRERIKQESFDSTIAGLDKELARLTTDHYILLKESKEYESDYREDGTYLKVTEATPDSVSYIAIHYSENIPKSAIYHLWEDFQGQAGKLDTFTLARSALSAAIPRDAKPDNFSNYQPFGVDFLSEKNKPLIIKEIRYLKGPHIIRWKTDYSRYKKTFQLEIRNYGAPALFTEIKNVSGDIEWNIDLPIQMATSRPKSERILLEGMGTDYDLPYEFVLYFIDMEGQEHQFRLKGKGSGATIERIRD